MCGSIGGALLTGACVAVLLVTALPLPRVSGASGRVLSVLRVTTCTRMVLNLPMHTGHDCWTRGYGDPELYMWLQLQTNKPLTEHGLEWAREQMQELMVHRCATTIQKQVKLDPFVFKAGLKKASVTASSCC